MLGCLLFVVMIIPHLHTYMLPAAPRGCSISSASSRKLSSTTLLLSDDAKLQGIRTTASVHLHCVVVASQVSSAQVDPADGLLYLSNSHLKIGMDPKRGGAITYLSSPVMPPEWADRNLINTWDSGRLIQQSYYGA
jgi:hypothetical protein